jgi:large subunit ribosomal protein L35
MRFWLLQSAFPELRDARGPTTTVVANRTFLEEPADMGKVKEKSHKGLRKRFKITGTGKVKRMQAGRGHLLTAKTGKRKRQLRRMALVHPSQEATYKRMLSQ